MLITADREWQAEIIQSISNLRTLEDCEAFLRNLDLDSSDADVDLFDRGLGLKSWLQGGVLSRIRPLPTKDEYGKPIDRGGMTLPYRNGKQMTFAEYIQGRLPFSVTTAHWVRKIHDVFTIEEARGLGYREMLSQLAPSFRKAMDAGPAMPNDSDVIDPDSNPEPGSQETIDQPGSGDQGGGEIVPKVKPLPVLEIPKRLEKMSDLLDRMLAVQNSPDRYNNVQRHLEILSDQQTRVDELCIKLKALPAVLESARQDIKHWYEAGIEASHHKACTLEKPPFESNEKAT